MDNTIITLISSEDLEKHIQLAIKREKTAAVIHVIFWSGPILVSPLNMNWMAAIAFMVTTISAISGYFTHKYYKRKKALRSTGMFRLKHATLITQRRLLLDEIRDLLEDHIFKTLSENDLKDKERFGKHPAFRKGNALLRLRKQIENNRKLPREGRASEAAQDPDELISIVNGYTKRLLALKRTRLF